MSSRSRKWQNCHRNPPKPCSKGLSPSTSGFSVVPGHLQHRHHSCPRGPERCSCHSSLALDYKLGRADHSLGILKKILCALFNGLFLSVPI